MRLGDRVRVKGWVKRGWRKDGKRMAPAPPSSPPAAPPVAPRRVRRTSACGVSTTHAPRAGSDALRGVAETAASASAEGSSRQAARPPSASAASPSPGRGSSTRIPPSTPSGGCTAWPAPSAPPPRTAAAGVSPAGSGATPLCIARGASVGADWTKRRSATDAHPPPTGVCTGCTGGALAASWASWSA